MISDTFYSGLLWATYLLFLLITGVPSPYPETGIVANVANTDHLQGSFVGSTKVWCLKPLKTSLTGQLHLLYVVTKDTPTTDNVNVFSTGVNKLATMDTG